ncbi:hypothetical protein [Chryseobacterium lathyri]|uniref:Uncharacterized protein n=1 Tax=Chryseobacterium lathyri TaxID=395933 RepID=A0A511YFV9_9FLAO|nr:hypothetical protein [Chryseobacterium lathyri]GEN74085.1 hypothetical protein CLA01_41570 [Chryseobacterium lathyri]
MPITAITYQPETFSLNSVYRPVIFRCRAKIPNATAQNYKCPVVFCDVYVDGVYYKSLARTQFIKDENQDPEYEFDIQDAVQELMGYNLPKMNGKIIEEFDNTIKKVFVKFRNAYSDSNGFSASEQVAPIQGTSSTPPVEGAGTNSNEIYVLNSVIQHEENQDLDKLLESYKTGTWGNAFPLTKRPKEFKICKGDSSHFPIISAYRPKTICVQAKTKSGSIIDICNEIIEDCPILSNIQYTITKDIPNNSQAITFTWTNPVNLPSVPYDIKIYRRLHGSNDPWSTTQITVYPTPVNEQIIITPFAYYDFVFEIIGRCNALEFSQLPIIENVGTERNSPPTISLRWMDNQGTEERLCSQNNCSAVIEVLAADPDNDIANVKILKSIDNGATWTVLIADLTTNTFTDSLDSVGIKKYKAVVTDIPGLTAESNIMTYKGNSMVSVDRYPDFFITIYKPDSGSHFIGQVKFYGLQSETVDGSNITKVEVFCRFRAIGENIWWQTNETHVFATPSPTINLTRQFVYGFRDNSKYIGTRDWNGADSFFAEFKIYTSSGEIKIFNLYYSGFPWYSDYNQAITL